MLAVNKFAEGVRNLAKILIPRSVPVSVIELFEPINVGITQDISAGARCGCVEKRFEFSAWMVTNPISRCSMPWCQSTSQPLPSVASDACSERSYRSISRHCSSASSSSGAVDIVFSTMG